MTPGKMTPEEALEALSYFKGLNPTMRKNAMKILKRKDAVKEKDPDHWDVFALNTPSRPAKVTRRGDLLRCQSCKKHYNQDQPCAHILCVMIHAGMVDIPNTSSFVYLKKTKYAGKGLKNRDHGLEQRAWRAVPSVVPDLLGRLLRDALPVVAPEPPPRRGRPPRPLHPVIYQSVMRVLWRHNIKIIQGWMDAPEHRKHNPHGSVGAATMTRFLSKSESTEVLEKLLALTTWPVRDYETLVHPDGTGLTEQHFSAYFDEKYRRKKQKKGEPKEEDQTELNERERSKEEPRRHNWNYAEILWTYRYTMIASMYSQQGPFGEAPWLIPLLKRASVMLNNIQELGGDKAYVSYEIFDYAVRNGIDPQIKFKKNTNPTKSYHKKKAFKRTYEASLVDPEGYATKANRRNNAEVGNHALKMILGDQIYSKTATAQRNELLCMAIAYNLIRLVYFSLHQEVEVDFTGGIAVLKETKWRSLRSLHRSSQG